MPLFLAARGGHLELAKGLIKNKAAVNFQGAQQNIGGCGHIGIMLLYRPSFRNLAQGRQKLKILGGAT